MIHELVLNKVWLALPALELCFGGVAEGRLEHRVFCYVNTVGISTGNNKRQPI